MLETFNTNELVSYVGKLFNTCNNGRVCCTIIVLYCFSTIAL